MPQPSGSMSPAALDALWANVVARGNAERGFTSAVPPAAMPAGPTRDEEPDTPPASSAARPTIDLGAPGTSPDAASAFWDLITARGNRARGLAPRP